MEILEPRIERYALGFLRPRDPVLQELERLARAVPFSMGGPSSRPKPRRRRSGFPVVGPWVGQVLAQSARLLRARRVLELGSGFGYSAYWFLQGMHPRGEIFLTDRSESNLALAKKILSRLPRKPRLRLLSGSALDWTRSLREPFDIIFIDLDKTEYPAALRQCVPLLRRGGLLIADNVLWSGRVVGRADDPATRAIRKFNRLFFSHPDLLPNLLPIRDGVAVGLKI